MTEFSSDFTPLRPDGPLPPGLTADLIKRAFSELGIDIGEALRAIGVRRWSGLPVQRLHRALHEHHARLALAAYKHPRFDLSNLLYHYLLRTRYGRGIHARLIAPAERLDEDTHRHLLDPVRFADLIAGEGGELANLPKLVGRPSPATTLAEFALSFALLQTSQAHEILLPLLRVGKPFQEFFGATWLAPGTSEVEAPDDTVRPKRATDDVTGTAIRHVEILETIRRDRTNTGVSPRSHRRGADRPAVEANDQLASRCETGPRDGEGGAQGDLKTPNGERVASQPPSAAASTIPGDSVDTLSPPGVRQATVARLEKEVEATCARRQQLGAAPHFDRKAFDEATESEEAAEHAVTSQLAALRSEARTRIESLNRLLSPYIADVALGGPSDSSPQALAAWLDASDAWTTDLEGEIRELNEKLGLLKQITPGYQSPSPIKAPCRTPEAARQALAERSAEADRAVSAARDWAAELDVLREVLADCAKPAPSQSLRTIPPDDLHRFIVHARRDPDLSALMPLLIRLLGAREGWASGSGPTKACRILSDALLEASRLRDPNLGSELLSFLPVPMLQELLEVGDDLVRQQIVLATFRESIVRQQPIFFQAIWPCPRWRNRRSSLGSDLERFFEALYRLFLRDGNIQSVAMALGEASTSDTPTSDLDSVRFQAADDLAERLSSPTRMTGYFYHLRRIASDLYFRPLVTQVRSRDYPVIQASLRQLDELLRSGTMERAIIQEFGDERSLRPAHKESLRRFIEAQLQALATWAYAERNYNRARDRADADALVRAARSAAQHLAAHAAGRRELALGEPAALARCIATLLTEVRNHEPLRPMFGFLGELPAVESLFEPASASLGTPGLGSTTAWPSWAEASPRSERLWFCYTAGVAQWTDLLQDGIARLLLRRNRDPEAVLQSFLAAKAFEAIIEAADFWRATDVAFPPGIVEHAKVLLSRSNALQHEISTLTEALSDLRRSQQNDTVATELTALDDLLIEALAALESADLASAEVLTASVRKELAEHRSRLDREVAAEQRLENELKAWLSAAGIQFREAASVAELTQLIEDSRASAGPRRAFLRRLAALDRPGVPDILRQAARSTLREMDHPARWPSVESAGHIETYLELLDENVSDWVRALLLLEPGEPSYQRVTDVIELTAKRLALELDALTRMDEKSAPLLALLLDCPIGDVRQLHRQLSKRKLLAKARVTDEAEEGRGTAPRPGAGGDAAGKVLQRLGDLIAQEDVPPGAGRTVQEAFDLFGRGDYVECRRRAASAYRWDAASPGQRMAMAAIYACSRYRSEGSAYDGAALEAAGLALRCQEMIRDRSRVDKGQLLQWWLDLVAPIPNSDQEPLGSRVAAFVLSLEELPVGHPTREEFWTLLRLADAPAVADLIWGAVTNLPGSGTTAKARTALLNVLYALGEMEALDHLFEYAGDNRKYLNALIGMVSRAAQEPSPKLHDAIRRSLQALDKRLRDKPFKDFSHHLAKHLQFSTPQVDIALASPVLERQANGDGYRLLVEVKPDETDPPLRLKVELLETSDFSIAPGQAATQQLDQEPFILSSRELEFVVRPHDPAAARRCALQLTGETVSGQPIQKIARFDVSLSSPEAYTPLGVEELLRLYAGYDAKPVTGEAFVGRHEELAKLERAVCRDNPGAVVLYGVRRLGKTSLLDELRRRYCVTSRSTSRTLFLVVPVDTFEAREGPEGFLDRFFRLIRSSVLGAPKMDAFRHLLERLKVDLRMLQEAGKLPQDLDDAPLLMKTIVYLGRLKELAQGAVERVVLVLDEFDKLLESYRKGQVGPVEELVSQLRNLATENADVGIVLAGSDLMKTVIGHYRSALYGSAVEIELGCFDSPAYRREAREIIEPTGIRSRLMFSDRVVEEIVRITGGHPLYMKLVACAAAHATTRKRISAGTVMEATQRLVRNELLQGYLPDPRNLVTQPLQSLALIGSALDETLARMLLIRLAQHTSLERPSARWAVLSNDEQLLTVRTVDTWLQLRDRLRDARLITTDGGASWSFRFPILAEALRITGVTDFEVLRAQAMAEPVRRP